MQLDKRAVADILRSNQVRRLHHANTVGTASTFLQTSQLLSRGAVQDRGLHQTPQVSDASDQFLGVWHDIFFDACDVHSQASRRNQYGPILFKFDLTLLEDEAVDGVWVAKKNPLYWAREVNGTWVSQVDESDRWFQSIEELDASYKRTNFDYHIVLRSMYNGLPMLPYLRNIVLDNPDRMLLYGEKHQVSWLAMALGSVLSSFRVGGFVNQGIDVNIRECACRCEEEYRVMSAESIRQLFAP